MTQQANIHHFDGSSLDEDGECLLGYYFEITSGDLMGPYGSQAEAEAACQRAYKTGDF